MPAIQYFAELDKINAKNALGPVIQDMSERELRVALLYILHGVDIFEAIDSAREFRSLEKGQPPFGRELPWK